VKHVQAALIIGAFGVAGSAAAQNVTHAIEADVVQICGAFNGQTGAVDIDFGALADTPVDAQIERRAGSVIYRCKNFEGFTRTIASQNGGFMTLNGEPTSDDARRIPFTMQHTGGDGFPPRQITAPLVTSHRNGVGSNGFLRGTTGGNLHFRAWGVQTPAIGGAPAGTRVFAGTYRDTLTITVTAN
jgi:spore coat protein U-like protein